MRAVMRWYAWCLCAVSFSAVAQSPCYVPSLEAPLEQHGNGTLSTLPRGHLFQPLIADPKESRFFVAYRNYERPTTRERVGVFGVGETFPLIRRIDDCETDGLQLDIVGGIVGRFVLNNGRNDLIDADYNIALPLSWRHRNWSLRGRLFHESAHLGEDQLFQAGGAQRVKRSIDTVDMIISYDKKRWRTYFGGEYMFFQHPKTRPGGLHAGAEYYGGRNLLRGTARWVSGVDVKAYQEFNYDVDVSLKTGLSFGGRNPSQHHMQVLLEGYDGHANEGVFFEEKIRYYGLGIYFGF